jgi:CheY-like chemotaxis protein
MNGKICLSSVPGEGSEFAFHLPLVPACPSENSQPDLPQAGFSSVQNHAPKPAAGGPPVLVVDDDEASSKLAGILLESLGYKVQFAMDGLTAVESFAEGRYLAILMDMQMPVMDGIEATRRIRSMEQDSHVPVIALTANVMSGHRDLCLASGMDTFLTKPFKKAELDAVLRKITKGQGP